MTEEKLKLITGSLLHGIGRVICRQGADRRHHSTSGCDYLKTEAGVDDTVVLDCVRYHHASLLRDALLADNHPAYVVCLADNIAALADRRKREETDEKDFEGSAPLQSIFNRLNGNHQEMFYQPGSMSAEAEINYPSAEKTSFSEAFYTTIRQKLTDHLKGLVWTEEYLNSLLSVLETHLSYVPSSTAKDEAADISLYDHVKLTAAIASCLYDYLNEEGLPYRQTLLENEQAFYDREVFMLYSMDVSGIQSFIYTIASKHALKTLRARSFYLEIMMEHIIDLLLERLALSRANLIYSGGGHCYILLPNTAKTVEVLKDFHEELKLWFLENYQTALYVAAGYVPCSANALRNVPDGSYRALYHQMSAMISGEKQHRYSAADILRLNKRKANDYSRECRVCRGMGQVDEEGICRLCRRIEALSQHVLYDRFFTVVSDTCQEKGLPLPGGYSLVADRDETVLRKRMTEAVGFVRTYGKNVMYTGQHAATKLWVGDYTTGDTFEELADRAEGIDRIAVLRADVDNLGQAFVFGFDNEANQNRYVTLSRTAALSRHLSLFFKYFIRSIMEKGDYHIGGGEGVRKRHAAIIYSGGDDVFIAGAWNEVIELAIDLRNKFKRYTQGTLSISAGIGIYNASYPIAAIAEEVGAMEDASKHLPGKDAVTLMEDGEKHSLCRDGVTISVSDGTYNWEELEQAVIGEKYQTIASFLGNVEDRGMRFLYKLLELIRQQAKVIRGEGDKIHFARLVYLLARLEPSKEGPQKDSYRHFSQKMYQWIQSEKDCRQLKTAINLYVYMHRGRRESEDANH